MSTVRVLDDHVDTFAAAADTYLARRDLADTTVRAYGATFRRLGGLIGTRPLVALDEGCVADALDQLWGKSAPATYNRHRAAVSSLMSWTTDRGWTADNLAKRVERRRERRTRTQEARQRPIPVRMLEAIWNDRNHALRERTLWRMLYDTAARASEVLGLDVTDFDLGAGALGGHHVQGRATSTGSTGPHALPDRCSTCWRAAARARCSWPRGDQPARCRSRISTRAPGALDCRIAAPRSCGRPSTSSATPSRHRSNAVSGTLRGPVLAGRQGVDRPPRPITTAAVT